LADFSEKYMKNPVEISVENYVDPTKLTQFYFDVRDNEKFSFLVHLVKNENSHMIMIFCNTRRNSDFVAKNLRKNGVNAQVIHGGMEQAKRMRVLKLFDESSLNVLVCTDVAARGLDIKGVSHIYNYDLPSDARDYIHRIGRTARAGAEGKAVSIVTSKDYDNFSNIQRHYPEVLITRVDTPDFEKIFLKWEDESGSRGSRRNFGGRSNARGNFRGNRGSGDSSKSFSRPRTGTRFGGRSDSKRSYSSGNSRGNSGNNRSMFRGSRNRNSFSSGKNSGGDSLGREQRGERNKRSGGRDGFRGGGRNVRNKRRE